MSERVGFARAFDDAAARGEHRCGVCLSSAHSTEGHPAPNTEISITIKGNEQVAIVMEALHKAGFVVERRAGRAEQATKDGD